MNREKQGDILFRVFLLALLSAAGFCTGELIGTVHSMNAQIHSMNAQIAAITAPPPKAADEERNGE